MARWSVVRERPGCPAQSLYDGRLKGRAEEAYERGHEPGAVVSLYEFGGLHGRTLIKKSDDITIFLCSKCHRGINGDLAPAIDAATGQPVCEACCLAQRHARRASA